MRIPNAGEFLAIFAATGQLSDFSKLQGADSELSLLLAPQCNQQYKVHQGDICNSIAKNYRVPTYQIICENEQINGKCTNLQIGDEICLGRQGADCRETYVAEWPHTNAQSISQLFGIPPGVFEQNNYCVTHPGGTTCPSFNQGTVVCVARHNIVNLSPCQKIFVG